MLMIARLHERGGNVYEIMEKNLNNSLNFICSISNIYSKKVYNNKKSCEWV